MPMNPLYYYSMLFVFLIKVRLWMEAFLLHNKYFYFWYLKNILLLLFLDFYLRSWKHDFYLSIFFTIVLLLLSKTSQYFHHCLCITTWENQQLYLTCLWVVIFQAGGVLCSCEKGDFHLRHQRVIDGHVCQTQSIWRPPVSYVGLQDLLWNRK